MEQVPAGPGGTHFVGRNPGQLHAAAAVTLILRDPRTEMDIAVVGLGVSLTLKDGVCTAASASALSRRPSCWLTQPPKR